MSYSQQNQPHRRRRIAASIENNNRKQNFDYIVSNSIINNNDDPFFAARKRRDPKKSDLDDYFSSPVVIENVSLLAADCQQQNDENIAASTSYNDSYQTMGDRTSEFRTIGKNFQLKTQLNNNNNTTTNRKQQKIGQILAESAKFNQYARKIGADLASTFSKLEKLTLLIKKSGAFFDCGPEIDELRHIIKLDIEGMYRDVNHLQQMMAERQQLRNGVKNNQTATHSKSIVLGLQSKLASMSSEFRNVLEVRTENLRQQKTRRERLAGGPSSNVPSSMPPSASTGRLGSILLQDEYKSRGENTVLDIGQQQASNQKQLMMTGGQTDYLRSRVEAMENVESTIVDMGQIFSQLAHMIQEQGEMVQRIDTHVDEANLHVEAAHMQLLQYMRSISNNRWLALKVFGVLIVFFIIFIIFLV
uniref:t-SNARE coiled-coil homology domain-containing protein n=1 Tax=Romanomermis culicivorax TaxID=13658 RepID=A0A915J389_ROMCU